MWIVHLINLNFKIEILQNLTGSGRKAIYICPKVQCNIIGIGDELIKIKGAAIMKVKTSNLIESDIPCYLTTRLHFGKSVKHFLLCWFKHAI
mgnify:CR=1 FL=1